MKTKWSEIIQALKQLQKRVRDAYQWDLEFDQEDRKRILRVIASGESVEIEIGTGKTGAGVVQPVTCSVGRRQYDGQVVAGCLVLGGFFSDNF